VTVSGLSDATQISVAGEGACARRTDGSVACWGSNVAGMIGDGTTTDRSVPTPVLGLTDAISVAVGATHSCALRVTGDVVCWGNNALGQLGDGSTAEAHTPVTVMDP